MSATAKKTRKSILLGNRIWHYGGQIHYHVKCGCFNIQRWQSGRALVFMNPAELMQMMPHDGMPAAPVTTDTLKK